MTSNATASATAREARPLPDSYNIMVEACKIKLRRAGIAWRDADAMERLLFEELPRKVLEDRAYRNATRAGDRKNARLELERAVADAVASWFADAFKLFTAFENDPAFRRRLADACFGQTYPGGGAGTEAAGSAAPDGGQPIGDTLAEIGASVPAEVWEQVAADRARRGA